MTETKEQTLLERVEVATGPDREIDRDLWLAFGLYPEGVEDIGLYVDPSSGCTGGVIYSADPLTASLDAAMALCETVLPGWEWIVEKRKSTCNARVHTGYDSFDDDDGEIFEASASTPALALIAAVLKARAEALKEEG